MKVIPKEPQDGRPALWKHTESGNQENETLTKQVIPHNQTPRPHFNMCWHLILLIQFTSINKSMSNKK